jgi:HSP20 family protein
MRFDMPGIEPADIDVSVTGDTLMIRASRERHGDERNQDFQMCEASYGRFERFLTLPKGVKSDQTRLRISPASLELTMPASSELASRKIPFKSVRRIRSR